MALQIQIETTNVCNAACVFCPYPKMSRPKGAMSMELFKKIIDDAYTVPAIDHITITGLGEPLLDRFLLDRFRYIRKKFPAIMTDLYTNGTYLRPKVTDALIGLGTTVIYVSLNAVNAQKRRDVMKLDDWDTVMANIKYAIDASRGTNTKVVVKGVVARDLMEVEDQDEMLKMFNGHWAEPEGHVFMHLEGNWAGSMWPMRTVLTQPCHRAFGQIMVLWDGRVSLCCFDGEGQEILGDFNHQSIRDVYNGGRALEIRTAHYEMRRHEIPLCKNCTSI